MDSRQPQHGFHARPQDRLIQNPNHQPNMQPQHPPYPSYAPSTSQPPVHVPFSDPFPRHNDPFMPASQHQRRASYGLHGGDAAPSVQADNRAPLGGAWGNNGHHHPHPHPHQGPHQPPPPPPPLSAAHNTSYGASRRRSLPGGSPPQTYYAGSHEPPPPPPSYAPSRHMPPPSSPQQHPPNQRGPLPLSFPSGRELPGLGSGHRPGSSMSISSIIGGESGASHQPPHASPPTSTVATSPTSNFMQPPSPRRAISGGFRPEFGPYRRAPSPEKYRPGSSSAVAAEPHQYTAGSPSQASPPNRASPEQTRQGLPQVSQAYKSLSNYGSQQGAVSERDSTRPPANGVPPRPSSQPTGPSVLSTESQAKSAYEGPSFGRPLYGGSPEDRHRVIGEGYQSRIGAQAPTDGARERPVTVQPVTQSAFSPPKDHRQLNVQQGPNAQTQRTLFWRPQNKGEGSPESRQTIREESAFRPGYGHVSVSNQSSTGPVGSEEAGRPSRVFEHLHHRPLEQYQPPPTSDPNSADRRRPEQLRGASPMGSVTYSARTSFDGQTRRLGEEMQQQKSFLGLGPEANRKTGRASPLPQAVQGAQAQPVGPGGDPNIKSEFGRMFSGLGMGGLGSGAAGNGVSTPSRQSPLPQNKSDSLPSAAGGDLMVRVNSQSGRKNRRVKDENGALDGENAGGRATPGGVDGRDSKRTKFTHPSHHHHHHPHGHHHHHHHHRQDEELVSASPNLPPNATAAPFNSLRFSTNTPQNGLPGQIAHHHHHHHHAPHHHHHAPRATPAATIPSPKMPTTTILIQSVLDKVAKLPRRHLGSQLYETKVELPPPEVSLDDPFGFQSKSKRLPRFQSTQANCTFTIRVPRYYLQEQQRREICSRRHLWGARIYRDDSDPLAVAMHSGWIRGAWDPDTPIDKLDPRILAPSAPGDSEETLEKQPAAPVVPPPDMDLQITLLILPALEEYPQTVEYGLKSRAYHYQWEGMSFMVHKLRWVDEGPGSRGQERGAAALKNRLHAANALLSLATAAGEPLGRPNGTTQLMAN